MQHHSIAPLSLLDGCWSQRHLIVALTKREIASRYRGSVMGLLWAIFNPIFMLGVYTFVFSVVFKARWDSKLESKAEFALVLFLGLIVYNLFSECVSRAPSLITQNPNYVKKVVFPLEILPCITLGAALFQALASLLVWLFFYCVLFGAPPVTALFVPAVLTPVGILILAFSWLLASLGAFLRDLSQITTLCLSVLMFLSPVFYPTSALPEQYQIYLKLNPLTETIEQLRGALIYGTMPSPSVLAVQLLLSMLFAWLCFAWFQKTRRAFADVI